MGKWIKNIRGHARLWTQIAVTAVTNGYAAGFIKGKIYTGPTKRLCVPGLNCYSCPGALGSCPIGSLQAVLGSRKYQFSFYIVGFLILVGALIGRVVCGWLCPFGLVQDLLYKIPFVKKWKNLYGHRFLVWVKYLILAVFVVLLPLFAVDIIGQGSPWFCQYICPSGTLGAGIPMVLTNELLRDTVGFLYAWKVGILVVLLLLAIVVYRPFCKYLCPLGAIYGLFHPISYYRYEVDQDACIQCGKCQSACKMDIRVWEHPNSMECIRCGECIKSCPKSAIKTSLSQKTCPQRKRAAQRENTNKQQG